MKSEEELANEYPEIFEYWHEWELDGPPPQISVYGFQHNSGWNGIIESLCEQLERIDCIVRVTQSKEKLGGLRFYHNGVQSDDECDAYRAMGAIQQAEEMSFYICENCGNSAELRQKGWFRTLCEECWTEEKARRRDLRKS